MNWKEKPYNEIEQLKQPVKIDNLNKYITGDKYYDEYGGKLFLGETISFWDFKIKQKITSMI